MRLGGKDVGGRLLCEECLRNLDCRPLIAGCASRVPAADDDAQ
jgi:hypothetical protein